MSEPRIIPVDDDLYPYAALSRPSGFANQPKDFDWLAKNIPCQSACPAGTDIPEYLAAIARGEYDAAYRINLEDNVFPAILGRVCSRPCEGECRHGWEGLGESVAICFAKRSAADFAAQEPVALPPLFPSSGKSVAVIGAGVAGLAVARDLTRCGHQVIVYEKHGSPGGMLNQGIPEFRLPRDLIAREIAQITALGVQIVCNTEIGRDLTLEQLLAEHDAVAMAAGTLRPNLLALEGRQLGGIRHGLDFLLQANEYTDQCQLAGKVLVIGGGFTAMDCSRTALRLGVESVQVLYRRSRDEMLVTPGELEELDREGIGIQYNISPVAYLGRDGQVTGMRFVRTELGAPDASGRRAPIAVPGTEFEVPADAVLLATGQFPETSWIDAAHRPQLIGDDNWLRSGSQCATAVPRVFAAGDFALGATTLIDAIGHARACAREIDTFLMGETRLIDAAVIAAAEVTGREREMDHIPLHQMPTIPESERTLTAEVETGYLEEVAREEATRCYLCHFKYEIDNDLCIYCDGCLRVKPVDKCIVKVASFEYADDGRVTGFTESQSAMDYNFLYIDQNECIRCGACADVCPVECIPLQKVNKRTVKTSEVYET